MSDGQVTRPQASAKKILSRDEFELCYLRHQYIRKTTYNPTEEEMQPYMGVIRNLSKNTFYTYQNLLGMVGLELDDVINIGRVHLTSYMGLFSLFSDDTRLNKFSDSFRYDKGYHPSHDELMNKDKADLTSFMKQRMEDLIRICRQKGRNIKGHCVEEFFTYQGPNKPPKILRQVVEDHKKYGFKKIDQALFRTIRKRAKPDGNVFFFNNLWYVAVLVEHKTLGIEDFSGAGINPYDSLHNMNPEEVLLKSCNTDWEDRKEEFAAYTREMKINKIKGFLRENRYNYRKLGKELATARRMLKDLEG